MIKDPITEMAAFKAGEIDFIASFSPEHVDTLKAQVPNAQIMTGKETTPMLAAMKVTVPKDGKPMSKERVPHPIFGDLRVRKAVGCYGIDRKEIVKIAFKGQATPWVGMNPPGTLDTVDVNHLCPYDPAKAKAMLAEVGYGPSKPLTFEIIADTEKSVFNVIATVIKEQMARIGVTANIRVVDKVSWMNTTLQDGPWDMYVEDLLSLITLDSNGYLSNSTSTWSHPRHNDTQGGRALRPLRAGDGRGQAQGDRQGDAGVHGRQHVLEQHLGLALLHGRPAVDEGLHVQRGVRGALGHGLAGQVSGVGARRRCASTSSGGCSQIVPTVLMITLVVFVMMRSIPGDPVVALLGDAYTEEDAIKVREAYGLDQPVLVQYAHLARQARPGRLGRLDPERAARCSQDVLVRLPVTLELIVLSMGVALAIAIPAAIIGALRQNTWADYTATSVAMIGVSIPEFFIGVLLLLVFSIGLGGLLPSSGWVYLPGTCPSMVCGVSLWGNIQHVLMPAVALGVGRAALLTRLLRASMLEVIRTEYVTTARAKGLSERPVVLKHALKNALIPTITVMGLQVGFLIGGAIVVETLFAMPGLGTFGIDAIIARDYQQVQGFALITALAFVVINLLVDLTYTFLDPRIRYA